MEDRARLTERLLRELGEQIKRDLPIPERLPKCLTELLRQLEERTLPGQDEQPSAGFSLPFRDRAIGP